MPSDAAQARKGGRARPLPGEAVAALCEALPEVEADRRHGMPIWQAHGKHFASFVLNHHGDGHVGLLLKLPPGLQQQLVEQDATVYYVPAYYGTAGWVGVELNSAVRWRDVVALTIEAWRAVVPAGLAACLEASPRVDAPRKLKAEEIDPFLGGRGRALLVRLRELCLALPETVEDRQFGTPCFRVGKKTFCVLHPGYGAEAGFALQARVGADRQAMLTFDDRYRIPAYVGRNGWIELALAGEEDGREIEALVHESYRHFAPKRALRVLEHD